MDKPNPEALIQELRLVTARLNRLSEYVRTLQDQMQHTVGAEQRMYAFLGTIVDKVLQHRGGKHVS